MIRDDKAIRDLEECAICTARTVIKDLGADPLFTKISAGSANKIDVTVTITDINQLAGKTYDELTLSSKTNLREYRILNLLVEDETNSLRSVKISPQMLEFRQL